LKKTIEAAGATLFTIAPRIAGARRSDGALFPADGALVGSPSVLFDAVVLALGPDGGAQLAREAAALDFVRDAFAHLKVIGYTATAQPLLAAAGITAPADGLVQLAAPATVTAFMREAEKHRVWSREPSVRTLP
jgi:catalase